MAKFGKGVVVCGDPAWWHTIILGGILNTSNDFSLMIDDFWFLFDFELIWD